MAAKATASHASLPIAIPKRVVAKRDLRLILKKKMSNFAQFEETAH